MKMFKLKPLASSVALSLLTGIAVAAPPGGAVLQNKVTVTYTDIGGKAYTAESNIVEISIREVRTATLTITSGENQQVPMVSGSKVYSVHTLTNNGNVAETYALAAANVTGGGDTLDAADIKIYLDANGNGALDTEETTPITSQGLTAGASAKLIVETVLPATIAASDTLKVTLDATDSTSTVASSTNTVNITFQDTNVTTPLHVWDQLSGGNCHAYTVIQPGAAITWANAKTQAATLLYQGKTGHLVTPTSAEENAYVAGKIPTTSGGVAWIGLEGVGSSFAWVTGEAFSYTNWASGNPDGDQTTDAIAMTASVAEWSWGLGKWGDAYGTLADNRRMYIVEFDTDCDLPSVAVELEGAKDVACDGTADDVFGTVRLEEMGSGECAIMRSRATNNGESLAKGIVLNYTVPQYATYQPDTLSIDGVAQTDAADADTGTYTAASKTVSATVGDVAVGATSPDAQFSVKID
ncbi:MAG: C-type lectin domain-containing protein [Gammaproteobacteria bacterium]|nr:C-type lectin domain-containing protein [Gammaproteobacteria bacterium]MBU1722601.1 C-type lectin domain-containing protein [Gammaproteobacteria bacterium]MBU2007073.1 C-type lectin domain-containing protein [Gammaproteobacteria bacterium]